MERLWCDGQWECVRSALRTKRSSISGILSANPPRLKSDLEDRKHGESFSHISVEEHPSQSIPVFKLKLDHEQTNRRRNWSSPMLIRDKEYLSNLLGQPHQWRDVPLAPLAWMLSSSLLAAVCIACHNETSMVTFKCHQTLDVVWQFTFL
jgi:hypothetical protein